MALTRTITIFALLVGSLTTPLIAEYLDRGDDAPDFFLRDQEGFMHSLEQHRGQYVMVFFYPRDFIPYSVKEVRAFENAYQSLKHKNVVIYGVSNDFQDKHQKFHEAFKLTYDLLSDPEEDMIRAYGARNFFGRRYISFLIGPDGRIFRKYNNASPSMHPSLALADIPN